LIRGVIFDLFHTLTGLESEWSEFPPTSKMLGIDRRLWDEIDAKNGRRRLSGEQRDPFLILREMAHHADPAIPDDRIRAATENRVKRFRHALQRIPEANIATLRHLRAAGLRLGLISNADAIEVASWQESPLAGLFDFEVFSCDVGLVKPELAIYRVCLDGLALSPGECLYVGDGGSNELVGAKDVGLRTVLMSGVIAELWPERIPERIGIADHHIKALPEILSLIRNRSANAQP